MESIDLVENQFLEILLFVYKYPFSMNKKIRIPRLLLYKKRKEKKRKFEQIPTQRTFPTKQNKFSE